ncbi:hypothetical protein Tco_0906127 [Tanacetum coccineum]
MLPTAHPGPVATAGSPALRMTQEIGRAPVSTDTELGRHMTAFEIRVRQDMDEIYTRLDDEQSQRQLLTGRLNVLFRDRRAHAYTRRHAVTLQRPEGRPLGDLAEIRGVEDTDSYPTATASTTYDSDAFIQG